MNFSGISNGSLLGKLMRLPLKLIPPETRMSVLQGPLKGKKWIAGAHTHGCWMGSYEQDKQTLFAETIQEGAVIFDIGANAGFYTLLASVRVGPAGRVFAFEPLPRNLKYLEQHLRLNHLENVTVVDAAVSDSSGNATFEESPDAAMGRLALNGTLSVRLVSLDDLISTAAVPAPDLIKIDVEGAELQVLTGASRLLSTIRPIIFLATHGEDIHKACCSCLGSFNYRIEPIGKGSVEKCDEIVAYPTS